MRRLVERIIEGCIILGMVWLLLFIGGCSFGASLSTGVGGSIHNPNHKRLPEVIRETPIISTSTSRAYALPLLKGGQE